jgi:hypothetical protein
VHGTCQLRWTARLASASPAARERGGSRSVRPPLVPEPAFTRARILRALEALGDELTCEGVRGQIFIVGGAAMALAYSTRRVVSPGSSRSWLTWLLQVDEAVGELLVGDVTDRGNQGADAGHTAREPG